jgi:hypothetical protein
MGRPHSGIASFVGLGEEVVKRGWFAVNALKRLVSAQDKRKQFDTEKRFFAAHKQASADRRKVDMMIDAVADVYGPLMGWYLGPNENHCAICIDAAGQNFRVERKPKRGWPGSSHVNCNCSPGAPFPGATLLR